MDYELWSTGPSVERYLAPIHDKRAVWEYQVAFRRRTQWESCTPRH